MRFVIEALLIAAILFIMVRLWRRTTPGNRAVTTLLMMLFIGLAIAAILAPQLTTRLANAVGVGRGTDLLLYISIIIVLYVVVDDRLWRKDHERRVAEVVRNQALLEARLDALSAGPTTVSGVSNSAAGAPNGAALPDASRSEPRPAASGA